MKNYKVILFLGFILSLALYLAWDIQNEKKVETEKKESQKLFGFPPDQVNFFAIEKSDSPDAKKIVLTRSVDGWKLESPVVDLADNTFTDDFINRAVVDSYVDVATEGDQIDWRVYGLEKPIATFVVQSQSGQQKKLILSARQNFEQNSIARLDEEKRVLIVPSAWSSYAQRSALDFRDKRFLRSKISSVDKLNITNKRGSFEIEMKEGQWIVPGKPNWILDQNKVRELLSQLSETRVKDFLETTDSIKNMEQLLLINSKIGIQLRLGDTSWTADFYKTKNNLEYAVRSQEPKNILMDNGKWELYSKFSVHALREMKDLFNLDIEKVQRIEISTALKKMVFFKKENLWNLEGQTSIKDVNQEKVQNLMNSFKGLKPFFFADSELTKKWSGSQRVVFLDSQGRVLSELRFDASFRNETWSETPIVVAKINKSDLIVVDSASIENLELQKLAKVPALVVEQAVGTEAKEASELKAVTESSSEEQVKTPKENSTIETKEVPNE